MQVALLVWSEFFVNGCSGGASATPAVPQSITVNLSQSAATVDIGTTLNLTAVVNDPKNAGVSWTLTGGGALSNQTTTSVMYTGPSSPGSAMITATAVSDTTKSARTTVTVAALPTVNPPAQIPPVTVGQTYTLQLAVDGGTPPFTWTVAQGQLPNGLSLDAKSGLISGTSQTAVVAQSEPALNHAASTTTVAATVQVADSSTPSQSSTILLSFTVSSPAPVIQITTASLPSGGVNVPYVADLAASGGIPPYSWSATSLPNGLSIDAVSGTISGLPAAVGSSVVNITAHDSETPPAAGSASYTLSVNARGIVAIISESSSGTPATAIQEPVGHDSIVLSGNGRYAAFAAAPAGLVPQTLKQQDIYWHDSCLGAANCSPTTLLASAINEAGAEGPQEGNGPSANPTITADGRLVGFSSSATNLVPNLNLPAPIKFGHFYIRNTCIDGPSTCTPLTDLVDETTSGVEPNQNAVFFGSGIYDMAADGGHVIFITPATNLLPSARTPGLPYMEDTACTVLALPGEVCSPTILVVASVHASETMSGLTQLSQSGALVLTAYPALGLVVQGTCLRGIDQQSCIPDPFDPTVLVPVGLNVPVDNSGKVTNHVAGGTAISGNGEFVAFGSPDPLAPNSGTFPLAGPLFNIFLRDTCWRDDGAAVQKICQTGTTTTISVSNSLAPPNDITSFGSHAISADGRLVIFVSRATNLVQGGPSGNGDMGVFIRDTCRNAPIGCQPSTVLVSVDSNGSFVSTGGPTDTAISADGHYCAFSALITTNGLLRTEWVLALTGF